MKLPRFCSSALLPLMGLASALGCRLGPEFHTDWQTRGQFEHAVAQLSRDEDGPSGVTYLVSQRGQVSASKSFGHLGDEAETPVSHDAAFQWWSVTKVATAVAVLQLAERQKLHLGDPVQKYITEFQPEPHGDGDPKPTIRQLLNHTSGLDDIGMKILTWIHTEGEPRRDQGALLEEGLALRPELQSSPGTEAAYSNLGYLALAVIIESVSGKTYEHYVHENVLEPLGMDRTGFVYTDAVARVEAVGTHPRDAMGWGVFAFLLDEDRVVARRDEERYYFRRVYAHQMGATGLIGPPTDLLKLGEALLQGGTRNGARILRPSSVRLMAQATLDSGREAAVSGRPLRFGAPWFIEDHPEGPRLSHAGAGMGYVAFLQLRPGTQTAVVVMGNGTYLDGSWGERIAEGAARFADQDEP